MTEQTSQDINPEAEKPKVSLKTLDDRVKGLEDREKETLKIIERLVETTPVAPERPSMQSASGVPIPYEYREIVNSVLNKNFEIDIAYLPEAASFQFSILVPKKYSNATPGHWETMKEDKRSQVIQNALGADGVRTWCNKVYENLSPEIKSQVSFDRSQP